MSTDPSLHVDNRGTTIGLQVVAERVCFGGDAPSQLEREALRRQLEARFAEVVARAALGFDARVAIEGALERLLGARGEWIDAPGHRLASVTVDADDREDVFLPLELLRSPTADARPVVLRCAIAETETVAAEPGSYPEGGRIVLATADAGGAIPYEAVLGCTSQACRRGLHMATGSDHDRKRGAFDPALDHLPRVGLGALRRALGPRDERPGAAVLLLACHVREGGLCLHDDDEREVLVDPEALASVLGAFAPHLRLVVLAAVAERPEGDPGHAVVELALALHQRGMAAVVAPRVPLPASALPGLTTALFGALLGDACVPPRSLEGALALANGELATKGGLALLGLRLFAHATHGHDTRPLIIRPYRGLLSFDPEHARFYVGREDEIHAVARRLAELEAQQRPRLLLLMGASGVGKSSLAKAGVAPALAKAGWGHVLTRPAQHAAEQLEGLVSELGSERRLLVVDSLEEVFTERTSLRAAAGYLQRLWALATIEHTAVVATLRVEALDRGGEVKVDGDRTLEQLLTSPHMMFVHHLGAEALERVITEPARRVGLELDPGLVDRLCAEAVAEPGALPMLELVLDELWSHRDARQLAPHPHEGGLAERLALYASKCVSRLPEAQQAQAKRILVRLATGPVVELATWRRRSTVEALRPERPERRTIFDDALAALVEARLVVRGNLRGAEAEADDASLQVAEAVESVELAHELLLRRWDALRAWIAAAAPRLTAIRDLERWVEDWREHGTTLLTREQLVYIEQSKLSVEDDDLNGEMLALIEASRRAVHQRKRIQRAFFSGLGVVTVAFAVLSYWALDQRETATDMATRAVSEGKRAQSAAAAEATARAAAERDRARAIEQEARRLVALARVAKEEDPLLQVLLLQHVPREWSSLVLAHVSEGGIDPVPHARLDHEAAVSAASWSPDGSRAFTVSEATAYVWSTSATDDPVVLDGHGQRIAAAHWHPDGSRIVTASWDRTARIWDADGTSTPVILSGHAGKVVAVQWSPDGSRILTGSSDGTARVWEDSGMAEPMVLPGHERGVTAVEWSSDGARALTRSQGGIVRAWILDGPTSDPIVLRGPRELTSAAWSADGHRIAAGASDGSVYVWSTDGGEPLVLGKHAREVVSAEWSRDGARVLTGAADDSARIWHADGTGEAVRFRGHRDGLSSASWSPDGSYVLTASWDDTARVWSNDGSMKPIVLRGHASKVTSAEWSPDGRWILTSSADGTARMWSAEGATEPSIVRGHTGRLRSAKWSPDGARIVTTSDDGTARVWARDAAWSSIVLRGHEKVVVSAEWSPSGTHVLTASLDRTARIWQADGTSEPVVLRAHTRGLVSARWRTDGAYVLTTSLDGTARVWKADGTGEPAVLGAHTDRLTAAEWSPDGTMILTTSVDQTARVWRVSQLQAPVVLRGHTKAVKTGGWSPDGARVVTASLDGTARVWRADGAGEPVVLRGHEGDILAAVWKPCGAEVLTTAVDGTARVWNADDGSALKVLRGHEGWVVSARWCATGRCVLTASADGTARVWDVETGTELVVLRGRDMVLTTAEWSPDEREILTLSNDPTAQIWTFERERLLERLFAITTAALTPADRERWLGASLGNSLQSHWDATNAHDAMECSP